MTDMNKLADEVNGGQRPVLEVRYAVIKFSDLSEKQFCKLMEFLSENCMSTRSCVVVERGWPMYDETVAKVLGASL